MASAAFACKVANVWARKEGMVQVVAAPRAVARRKSRRVFKEGSLLISSDLVFRCAHDQPDGFQDVMVIQLCLRFQVLFEDLFLLRFEPPLKETFLQSGQEK